MSNMLSFLLGSTNNTLISNSKGLIIGDSTIGFHETFNDVKYYLDANKPIDSLATITSIAQSGDNIVNQQTKYNLLTTEQKIGFDWICIEIGINDIVQNFTQQQIRDRFEALLTQIRASSKIEINILCFTLTPCHTFMLSYGSIYPDFQSYLLANTYNATLVSNSHTLLLSDGIGDLQTIYKSDQVHENNAGRNIIAVEWAKHLRSLGFNI